MLSTGNAADLFRGDLRCDIRSGNVLENANAALTLGRCRLPPLFSLKSPAPGFQPSFPAVPNNSLRPARPDQDHPSDPELPQVAFALDSSILSLSLNWFPWGSYARSGQSALKLHLMLSLRGNLPAWGTLTPAGFPDLKSLDRLPVIQDAYYVMDRGCLDFIRLDRLHQAGGFFVVCNKHPVKFRVRASRPVDKTNGLRCDQTIPLSSPWSRRSYPVPLRRIRVYDADNHVTLVRLTNQFAVPAAVTAELYRNPQHSTLSHLIRAS